MTYEFNFDGLIGPSHNFSGLSYGNLASAAHQFRVSRPKAAALQGLSKMKLCHELGLKQGFFPPQERPNIRAIRELGGYAGKDRQILERVSRQNPELLLICSSASAMWSANSATISPSADTRDKKIHITPANLISEPHRAIETYETERILKTIFHDDSIFTHHSPLKSTKFLSDEGAANHMRLGSGHGGRALEIFVHGRRFDGTSRSPEKYPARQSFEASLMNARQHALCLDHCQFIQQNPEAIDAGAFHNDVMAVTNEHVLIYHEKAFEESDQRLKELSDKYHSLFHQDPCFIQVRGEDLTLNEAVKTYLFNSQLVTLPQGEMALIVPQESFEDQRAKSVIMKLLADENPVKYVHHITLRESMRNGGGPACLRLRVVLTEDQISGVHGGFILTDQRFADLEKWIHQYFRDKLDVNDLRDELFLDESRRALDALTQLIGCGSIYDFQR